MQPHTHDRLLDRRTVEGIAGLARASLYALMNHPDPAVRFPKPIKIGESRVRWSERSIQDWIERQKARSTQTA